MDHLYPIYLHLCVDADESENDVPDSSLGPIEKL